MALAAATGGFAPLGNDILWAQERSLNPVHERHAEPQLPSTETGDNTSPNDSLAAAIAEDALVLAERIEI